jgi:hypothetical protein
MQVQFEDGYVVDAIAVDLNWYHDCCTVVGE